MNDATTSVVTLIRSRFSSLTRAEKQASDALLAQYPASAIGSITQIADRAGVSTPTIARLVRKLGFAGFAEFQQLVRGEIGAESIDPISKFTRWYASASDQHVLNRFTEASVRNIYTTLNNLDRDTFENLCCLLCYTDNKALIAGGRISKSIAEYFFIHLQVMRSNVVLLSNHSNSWPHYLLDVQEKDLLILFDMRRYENTALLMARMAHERQAKVILFTDQWHSPAQRYAHSVIDCRIEVPSAWDSNVATMLIVEAVLAEVQKRCWTSARDRIEKLEHMFNQTLLFRKFT